VREEEENKSAGDLSISTSLLPRRNTLVETTVREEQIKHVREQWKRLWQERVDDKVRAEGIASEDFSVLFVDRGTVILATRSFKMLNLRDVLDAHGLTDFENKVFPNTAIGGWSKFIRTSIVGQKTNVRASQRMRNAAVARELEKSKQRQHLKKGGRGWLHA